MAIFPLGFAPLIESFQRKQPTFTSAIEARTIPDRPSVAEQVGRPVKVGSRGVAIIKQFEGCHRVREDGMICAYPDPGTGGQPWTIGWGATLIDGRGVRPTDVITQAKADHLLGVDIARHAKDVVDAIGTAPTSQLQFDALASFHFNTGALRSSTLLRKHLSGDFVGAADEFGRWIFAGGRALRGLKRRRVAEAALYREGSR